MSIEPIVLFDLDGTLLDPGGAITGGIAAAIEAHGYTRPDEATLRKFVGPSSMEGLQRHTDIPAEAHPAIVETYRTQYPELARRLSSVYPGVAELLADLRRLPVRIAIATQKPQPSADRIAAEFGLAEYCDAISGARDDRWPESASLPTDKPGILARALELLGAAGQDLSGAAVMVGDREYDAVGAAANGMPCIGVSWGFGTEEELTAAGAAPVADDVGQLRTAIAELAGLPELLPAERSASRAEGASRSG
ncbi:HAD hydrolase-like protein [Rothia halotolerans]|uniref:HAD hydrolase-like protein n=1 Tax=Rothia halotolerans TaxID=405770 RepID=UPI0013E9ADBF|nr:HAD hydrolase-like protein [Rothia halotolerans]